MPRRTRALIRRLPITRFHTRFESGSTLLSISVAHVYPPTGARGGLFGKSGSGSGAAGRAPAGSWAVAVRVGAHETKGQRVCVGPLSLLSAELSVWVSPPCAGTEAIRANETGCVCMRCVRWDEFVYYDSSFFFYDSSFCNRTEPFTLDQTIYKMFYILV